MIRSKSADNKKDGRARTAPGVLCGVGTQLLEEVMGVVHALVVRRHQHDLSADNDDIVKALF